MFSPGGRSTCGWSGGQALRDKEGEVKSVRAWFSGMCAVSNGGIQLGSGPWGQGRLSGVGEIHP